MELWQMIYLTIQCVLYRGIPIMPSGNWLTWITNLDQATCVACKDNDGKIFAIIERDRYSMPPLHEHCRCRIELLSAIKLGTATIEGINGADSYLKLYNKLPPQYVEKAYAKVSGWKDSKGNLWSALPGAVIGGDIYYNKSGKLPIADGRIWYEADINYAGGFRGLSRLVYSNDGLLFVTYDHYENFQEVN